MFLNIYLLCFQHYRFQGGKKEELIGIAYNRLIRMDASTGDAIKTWRFSNMKQWNVNWEIKMVSYNSITCILLKITKLRIQRPINSED